MAALGPTEPMPDQGNLGQNWREQVVNIDVNLRRGDQGFGFRIVGGPEEGTQVSYPPGVNSMIVPFSYDISDDCAGNPERIYKKEIRKHW